jgi:ferrous iron transport protein B
MNCGAKLPVYAVLIGAFFAHNQAQMLFLLTLLSWTFALFAAKLIRNTILRGPKTPFVMELPPYRWPTPRGLLIHTWERTWQYIKKAGTVILGFSVILWAMMTFPGLSDKQVERFEQERARLTDTFFSAPGIEAWIKDGETLMELNGLYKAYTRASLEGDLKTIEALEKSPFTPLVKAAFVLENGGTAEKGIGKEHLDMALSYVLFRQDVRKLHMIEQQAALKNTVAGWLGQRLETITRPLGFEYRTNIALVGGFAAKEIVVSTLGTAYSLGELDPEAAGSLSERLRDDPNWDPLIAFTFLVFTMLYVPCFVTVISIRKESSWAWAVFSMGFNLVVAYVISLTIRGIGLAFGLGN